MRGHFQTVWAAVTAVGGVVSLLQAAGAQTVPDALQPDAPIDCFLAATTSTTLSDPNAVKLCIGARSRAPASCLEAADDQLFTIADGDAVRLCIRADSTEPVECATQLANATTLTLQQIVSYCAASRWPLVPAPTAGAPVCVEAALDSTALTNRDAVELCRGARSIAPVTCFERGDDSTNLSYAQLTALCQGVVAVPVWPWSWLP